MTRVVVLLSTWNGMRFLPEQLRTLFAQEFPGELTILIRDDGSTDGTLDYLRTLDDPRIRVVKGENLGPIGSYFELLRLAKETDGDFFALCDQDDFWQNDKIARALSLIQSSCPAIYASSLHLVDAELVPIGYYRHPGDRSFVCTLLTNYVTGCTCVINRAFLNWMPFPEQPNNTIMHDWWLASVATMGALIVYDEQSRILYRQHGSNHVGIDAGVLRILRKVLRALKTDNAVSRSKQAEELKKSAGERMSKGQSIIVSEFIECRCNWMHRARFLFRHRANVTATSAMRFLVFG